MPCSGAAAARLAEGPCTLALRQTLAVLEFDSTRKRQSVIVRVPDGRILLYCKARPLPLNGLSWQGWQAAPPSIGPGHLSLRLKSEGMSSAGLC
jgi:hypothetical protein